MMVVVGAKNVGECVGGWTAGLFVGLCDGCDV